MSIIDGVNETTNDDLSEILKKLMESFSGSTFNRDKILKAIEELLRMSAKKTYETVDKISSITEKQYKRLDGLATFYAKWDSENQKNKTHDEIIIDLLKKFYDFTQEKDEREKAYRARNTNHKEYLNELRKFQDRNAGGAILDHYLEKSPALRMLFKRDPKAPGSEFAERERSRAMLTDIYSSREGFNRERQFDRWWGREGDDFMGRFRNQSPTYGMDQPQLMGNVKGLLADKTGKDHSNESPSIGDLARLPAIYGEPALYLGDMIGKLIEKEDDTRHASSSGKGLADMIKNLGLPALLGGMLPEILGVALPILAAGASLAGILLLLHTIDKKGKEETLRMFNTLSPEDQKKLKDQGMDNDYNAIIAMPSYNATKEEKKENAKRDFTVGNSDPKVKMLEMEKLNFFTPGKRYLKRVGASTMIFTEDYPDGLIWGDLSEEMKLRVIQSSGIKPKNEKEAEKWNKNKDYGMGQWVKGAISVGKFHTGGVVPGNDGEEKAVMALAGERVLNPEQSKNYEASVMQSSKLEEKVAQLIEINKQLLDEMKNNTVATKDGNKNVSTTSPVSPASKRYEKAII